MAEGRRSSFKLDVKGGLQAAPQSACKNFFSRVTALASFGAMVSPDNEVNVCFVKER